jgi:flavodoxin
MLDLQNQIEIHHINDPLSILVAYFSISGNTRKIAKQIQMQTGGDIFEIRTMHKYPLNYNELLAQAKKEIVSGAKPSLRENITNMETYRIVFLGYPNWWNTIPAPVLTILTENDFTNKIIVPFCTHGGGGIGHSVTDIKKQLPEAKMLETFSINGSYVKETNSEVANWIGKIINSIYA